MRAAAVVPAYNNAAEIADTVRSLLSLAGIEAVYVCDDGSSDDTASIAQAAGAVTLRSPANQGKAAALERGFEAAAGFDVFAMVDADTGRSAAGCLALIDEVTAGRADMCVGILPPAGSAGGFGLVRRAASLLIRLSCGFSSSAPLSGQRAMTPQVISACRPLATGFGVDPALTADAVAAGFRVSEIPVAMSHRSTGRGLPGFAHRARQGFDLLKAFVPRLISRKA